MRIGGYMPFSFSDFPGVPAAVVFTQGCNFRCPFCHNWELIPNSPGTLTVEQAFDAIMKRRKLVHGVVVSGGEPCAQKELPDFCQKLKKAGLKVKLDTNGSFPSVLGSLVKSGAVDYVAMDIKAPSARYNMLAGVDVDMRSINESVRVLTETGVQHHFRTTNVRPLLSDNDINEIKASLPSGSKHVLQKFCPETAFDARFFVADDECQQTGR